MKRSLLHKGAEVAVKPAGRRRTQTRRKATVYGIDSRRRRALITFADSGKTVAVPYDRIADWWRDPPKPLTRG